MRGFSFDPTWIRTLPAKLAGVCGAFAALGLMVVAPTSSSHAQALDTFAVLAGQTVTNTGTTFINGNLGVWPGTAVTGFGGPFPSNGTVTAPYTIYAGNAVAQQAQGFLTAAYLSLQGMPPNATGVAPELAGATFTPGVYKFASSALLTGSLVATPLTLDGGGVYVFQIPSTLTSVTPNAQVILKNGATGGNVFFVVDSATLGVGTSFQGSILALTSIELQTGTTINCGAALARNGSVTLDTNTITICSNSLLANAFTQSSGEVGTGAALAGIQAMNSFLSLVTNPFENNRPFAPAETRPLMPVKAPIKALGYGPESPQSPAFASVDRAPFAGGRRWGIWAAAYGGQNNTTGDLVAGTHNSSARTFGFATGLDYLVTPYTVVGFALAGGGTNYGLSDGLGSGHSDMFQAAVYSMTRVNAAYVSTALAYAWHRVSTERDVTLVGTEHLTADFSANSVGGRIEGGYRFAIPGVFDSSGFGLTPYAALQAQAFHTPSYSESSSSSPPAFALAYNAHTTTAVRTELGSWVDKSYALDRNNVLSLFGRAAWAHDWYSDPSLTAAFLSAPLGPSFTVNGATPVKDSALLTAGAQLYMRNGWSVMAKLDSEFAPRSQTYMGTARLRYTW